MQTGECMADFDPSAITAALALLSKGRSISRALRQSDLSDKHKEQIRDLEDDSADLNDRIFGTQGDVLRVQDENEQLRKQVSALEDWNS